MAIPLTSHPYVFRKKGTNLIFPYHVENEGRADLIKLTVDEACELGLIYRSVGNTPLVQQNDALEMLKSQNAELQSELNQTKKLLIDLKTEMRSMEKTISSFTIQDQPPVTPKVKPKAKAKAKAKPKPKSSTESSCCRST